MVKIRNIYVFKNGQSRDTGNIGYNTQDKGKANNTTQKIKKMSSNTDPGQKKTGGEPRY